MNRPRHVLEEVGDELAGEPVEEERLGVGHHHVEEAELDERALLVNDYKVGSDYKLYIIK